MSLQVEKMEKNMAKLTIAECIPESKRKNFYPWIP